MFHLPKDIITYIYSFDPTYKIYFEKYIKYILNKQRRIPSFCLPLGTYRFDTKHGLCICVDPSIK